MNYDCSNVLLEERWRFCANFKIGHERGREVEPSTCPYRTQEYGCIGCTKFAPYITRGRIKEALN